MCYLQIIIYFIYIYLCTKTTSIRSITGYNFQSTVCQAGMHLLQVGLFYFIWYSDVDACTIIDYWMMFDLLWLQTSPGLEECMQSRPPLQLDLTGPKPTTYDPPTTLPWETSSPSYTMRPKTQPERGIATTVHMLSDIGEQGWHSDGSTCSRSMWPGLKSWCQHHMWVEFVVQFFLSFALRGFYSGFRLSSKTNIFKFQCDEEW